MLAPCGRIDVLFDTEVLCVDFWCPNPWGCFAMAVLHLPTSRVKPHDDTWIPGGRLGLVLVCDPPPPPPGFES